MTTVTVTQRPITATVVGQSVQASVPAATPAVATVTGGVGPRGATGGNLADLQDVQIDAANNGDLLRYSNGKWRDFSEQDIVIDGQNF